MKNDCGITIGVNRHRLTFAIKQTNSDRNMKRFFVLLTRCWWTTLANGEGILSFCFIIIIAHLEYRCSSLSIPTLKLGEVNGVGIFHSGDKVLSGDGLTIMALKIEIGTLAETFCTHKSMNHADNLRTLFIDSERIEVTNLNKRLRTNSMRHWPGIFHKLSTAHDVGIFNTLDHTGVHIGSKLRIPEDGKTLFQAELEPIPAGNPVT